MKLDTADELFYSIRNDCLKLISSKNVDLDDLSYSIGCSTEKLISLFNKRDFWAILPMNTRISAQNNKKKEYNKDVAIKPFLFIYTPSNLS